MLLLCACACDCCCVVLLFTHTNKQTPSTDRHRCQVKKFIMFPRGKVVRFWTRGNNESEMWGHLPRVEIKWASQWTWALNHFDIVTSMTSSYMGDVGWDAGTIWPSVDAGYFCLLVHETSEDFLIVRLAAQHENWLKFWEGGKWWRNWTWVRIVPGCP